MGIVRSKIKSTEHIRLGQWTNSDPSPRVRRFVGRPDEGRLLEEQIMAKVGDKVPSATLRTLGPEGPKAVTTEELFAPGKKVVAFALPGAFTPTCSAKHVPGFVAEAEAIKKKGVDTIACISVNDAFVMGAWGKDQKAGDKVLMLGDGNGEFTQAMGLTMDGSKFGLGTRSQRSALVGEDAVIKHLIVEKRGSFEVPSAENVLKNL